MRIKFISILALLAITLTCWAAAEQRKSPNTGNLFQNPDFRQRTSDQKPVGYQIEGSAEFGYPGNPRTDVSDFGAGLKSTGPSGSVSQLIRGIDIANGKWFRFTFRGLPQQNFVVTSDDLYMKVEFFGSDGTTSYDGKDRKI